MSVRRAQLIRGVIGGCTALALFLLIALLLNSGVPHYTHMSFASHSSIAT